MSMTAGAAGEAAFCGKAALAGKASGAPAIANQIRASQILLNASLPDFWLCLNLDLAY